MNTRNAINAGGFAAAMGMAGTNKSTLWWPQWDYQRFTRTRSVTACGLEFFRDPVGVKSDTSLKQYEARTQNETSVFYANKLLPGNDFLATGIRVLVVPGWGADPIRDERDAEDEHKLLLNGLLEFAIGNRTFFKGAPLARFPACFHVPQLFKPQTIELPIIAIRKEIEQQKDAYQAITPGFIPASQDFRVTVYFDKPLNLARDALLGVILDGYVSGPEY